MNISERKSKKYTEKGEKTRYERHIYEPGTFLAEIQ